MLSTDREVGEEFSRLVEEDEELQDLMRTGNEYVLRRTLARRLASFDHRVGVECLIKHAVANGTYEPPHQVTDLTFAKLRKTILEDVFKGDEESINWRDGLKRLDQLVALEVDSHEALERAAAQASILNVEHLDASKETEVGQLLVQIQAINIKIQEAQPAFALGVRVMVRLSCHFDF